MEHIFEKSLNESRKLLLLSEEGLRCRHFSFIFDGRRLVSRGRNTRKTHPGNLLHPYVSRSGENISHLVGTHSETDAVLRLGSEDCRGLTLVNVRINRKGRPDNSMPCRGCRDLIRKAGFARVIYTDGDGQFRELEIP